MNHSGVSVRKIHRREMFSLSTENLAHLYKMIPMDYYEPARPYTSRPIAFSKHRPKKIVIPQNFDIIKNSQPKGLIFVWPQRKRCRKEEYTTYMKIISHLFYWWDQLGLFPRGSGVPSEQPPWEISQPLPKPENRDYIIEPDWNSVYTE